MSKLDYLNAAFHYFIGNSAPKKIIRVIYDITYRCNLRCDFCYYWNKKSYKQNLIKLKSKEELGVDEIKDVLMPQLKKAKTTNITITGGEPLIREDIVEVMRMFSKNLKVSLLTNLTISNQEKLDAILKYADNIAVSLDLKEFYNKTRGVKNCFNKVIKNIEYLTGKRNDFLTINCVITPTNSRFLSKIIDIAKDVNVNAVNFQFLDWQTPETIKKTPFLDNPEVYGTLVDKIKIDAEKTFEQIEKAREKSRKSGVRISTFPPKLPLSKKIIDRWYSDSEYRYANKCLVPYFQARIDPYGGIMPCVEHNMGNIKNKLLLEIWNSKEYKTFRRMLKHNLFPRCNKCCKIEKSYNYLFHIR